MWYKGLMDDKLVIVLLLGVAAILCYICWLLLLDNVFLTNRNNKYLESYRKEMDRYSSQLNETAWWIEVVRDYTKYGYSKRLFDRAQGQQLLRGIRLLPNKNVTKS